VLISGSGSTLRNILERCAAGRLPGVQVVGVAASRDCGGLAHAREFGVPGRIVPRIPPDNPAAAFDAAEFSARLTAVLEEWTPDLIALGGFLSLYLYPDRWQGRIINIHPALLPLHGGVGMYGDKVHAAVLASGAKQSGCTVHLVSRGYDEGPILAQRSVVVLDGDTPASLGARVRAAEAELYPAVIQWFAEGRVSLDSAGQVRISGRVLVEEEADG
jgi:formyltetrahydrofolate-dependent phosphoribosylglycinamide formyltransferase